MTLEERIANLERRVADLERLTMPMMPLGPNPSYETLEKQRADLTERITESLRERVKADPNG